MNGYQYLAVAAFLSPVYALLVLANKRRLSLENDNSIIETITVGAVGMAGGVAWLPVLFFGLLFLASYLLGRSAQYIAKAFGIGK